MGRILCRECRETINENYNYCPNCGEPQNSLAAQKDQIRMENAGLQKLHELSKTTTDPAVLKAIKTFVQNEKQNRY